MTGLIFIAYMLNGATLGWNLYCISMHGGLLNYILAGISGAMLLFLTKKW